MIDTKKVVRDLSDSELAQVSGGMKVPANYQSKYVIDARGGSMTVYGVTMTFDVNGKCSSIHG